MTEREPGSSRRTALWLTLFAGIALAIRVGIYYHAVFMHDYVAFVETDAWYHMRLVDATVKNFPSRIWFDPYLVYPGGDAVNPGPFFDWIIAATALVIGLGAPSPRLVDVVGAYVPAVVGALTVLPVYVLGRELFSRRAGLWAAFIVGLLPGQILQRSSLGYADHHCVETLLTSTALMWIVLALDSARSRKVRLRCSAAAGVSFGCYLLTWSGGSLFVFVVVASVACSLIGQRLRGERAEDVLGILTPAFAVAALIIVPWATTRPFFAYDLVALATGLGGLVILRAWGSATSSVRHGRVVYIAGLMACVALGLAAAWFARDGWSGLAKELARISPLRPGGNVGEAMQLLKSPGRYPIPLWKEFSSSLFLALLGAIWYLLRPGALTSTRSLLMLVWTAVIFAATLGQVRFSYYLGVNAALLAGFACDELLAFVQGLRPAREAMRRWGPSLGLLVIVAVPSGVAIKAEWGGETGVSEDWYDALQWLQKNTPEPFGTPDAYDRPELAQAASAHPYGVLVWWDFGYWVTRLAHRIPSANPKQTQAKEVTAFLLAETAEAAGAALALLDRPRYVLVNRELQAFMVDGTGHHEGMFAGIAPWLDRTATDYCQEYELPGDSTPARTQIYCFPRYYQTMLVRLYAFGGRAVTPGTVTAIRWTDVDRGGRHVKRMEQPMTFTGTADAERFIASRPTEHWRIASADPLLSCTPLDALADFHSVFRSLGIQPRASGEAGPPIVQIYEYRPAARRP
jgi:dolichyl-diphosphooligosaccharide--protein glycosyltransferase